MAASEPTFERLTIDLPARGATLKDFAREGRKFGACWASNWMKALELLAAEGKLSDDRIDNYLIPAALKDLNGTLDDVKKLPVTTEYFLEAFEKAALKEWRLKTKRAMIKPAIG